jgi:tetratricopeptide (TPR) repeat protein
LSEPCTNVLTGAAVVGREFGLDVLEQIAEIDEERLVAVLEEALAARVVEEVAQPPSTALRAGPSTGLRTGPSTGLRTGAGRYRFAHALIRETLYEELRRLDRIRRHRRVAEVLEALYARNPTPHLAELAYHFLESLPGGDVDKAVDYATRAGNQANEQLAYEEAALHYERAIPALALRESPDDRLRCELLLNLGEARWKAGGIERPMGIVREAVDLAERLGDAELLARAALAYAGPGVGIYTLLENDDCLTYFAKALALLGERDSALRAQVMARHAALRTFMGDPQGREALGRAAIEMARRVGDKAALAYVLNVTPWAVWGPDNLGERLAMVEEEIRLAGEIGDGRLAAEGHMWKASHLLEIGDIAGFDREKRIQERFAETSRQAFHRWMAAISRGGYALLAGRFAEAEEHLGGASAGVDFQSADVVLATRALMTLLFEHQGRADELLSVFSTYAARYPRAVIWPVAVAAHRAILAQTDEAQAAFEAIAANDFSDIPRDLSYLYTMSRLSEVVSFLGDTRRAAILYDLLLPYADRMALTGGIVACRGSVSRPLGLLATVLSLYDDAERHFEKALELNARIRARVWVAHTQHDYARMLVARGAPGDREKAAGLAAAALATAREAGMKPLEAKVVGLRAAAGLAGAESVEPSPASPPIARVGAVFRQEGDFWTIAYEGTGLRLRDAKGLHYIAQLLRHAGREFHAADLAAGADTEATPLPDAGGEISLGLGDAGEVLDAQARSDYRRRLEDLRAELEEATGWGDTGRAARLSEEIEFLTEEISAAYGVGARVRKAGDIGNRARKAVTSRIRETIARVTKEHPTLGRHLENAIQTGIFCSYQPDRSLDWEL